jgi:DnaJ-class molecular chaperone
MSNLILQVESEYWFDAESIEMALNDYFGTEWNYKIKELCVVVECPDCLGRCGFNNAGGATSCSTCEGTGKVRSL